jgi:hypothetical protein
MSRGRYRFVFLVGAQGSGTTLLIRMLSRPAAALALGGNYVTIPRNDPEAFSLVEQFDEANAALWDRKAGHERHAELRQQLRRIVDRLLGLPRYAGVSHVLYKRSAPFFGGDRYRPDLADLVDAFADLRVIAIYRDPRAATCSALRRGYADNLRQCALISEEQLTYLAAQLATLDQERWRVVGYEALCAQPRPLLTELAAFCGLPAEDVLGALQDEPLTTTQNERWRAELDQAGRDYLDAFFDARRLEQWSLLRRAAA